MTKDQRYHDDDFLALLQARVLRGKIFRIFDDCHSGGLTVIGARNIRAITPRMIFAIDVSWNKRGTKWEERDLRNLNPDVGGSRDRRQKNYMGCNATRKKLGHRNESFARTKLRRQYRKGSAGGSGARTCQWCGSLWEGGMRMNITTATIGYGVFT